ncbi:apolipoprotein N-acyltransferase [Motiliproteus sp. SC1-56]|uniref:apolipoprotein N-acyltransferase n=1 Tax=Motiliproteus sp. SC1-56 TaxID=2799565 RepID=UPI001A90C49F|nr:apolipoprotein N-acyltransferase [Motiliproteus sp. SC1-56]
MPAPSERPSPGWRGHLLALLSGALAPLAFAPFHLWPLALVSCLGLIHCLQGQKPGAAAFRGWLYGVGFYGVGVSWVFVSIHRFGNAPVWLAGFLTLLFVAGIALFFALHAFAYRRLVPAHRLGLLLGFPALWVLAEWFRSWFLTGFPWLYLGYAPLDTWLAGWAPVSGIYSLSFLVALAASALYLLPRYSCPRRRLGLLALATLPLLGGALLQQVQWTSPTQSPPLRVALVQGNVPQALKWDPRYRQRIIHTYQNLSRDHLDKDLLVWPETALPNLLHRARPALARFEEQLTASGTALITGVPTVEATAERPRYYNAIAALGAAEGIYHKQRLVPFGEYVPLESLLRGLIDFFDLPMSNFSLGADDQPLLHLTEGTQVAASVCYEVVYPDLIARSSREAGLLLTVSNDSWFGDSLAPHQHLQMARMRALENGRFMIRSTNNGISALIGPDGQIQAQGPQFKAAVLEGEVQPYQGSTPFARWGSLPVLAGCALLLAGLTALPRARRARCSALS